MEKSMNHTIESANKAHAEALAQVAAFKKSGGKVKQGPVLIRKIEKGTINKKSAIERNKSKSMADAKKQFVEALEKHGQLTSNELVDYTGYEKSTVFNAAKELEGKGKIKRVKGKKTTDLTSFKLA